MNVRSLSVIFATIVAAVLAMVAPKAATAAEWPASRITGGTKVDRAEFDERWRSIVSISYGYDGDAAIEKAFADDEDDYITTAQDEHICGGTLVAPLVVVTAAHCVSGYDSFRALRGRYRVRGGTRLLNSGRTQPGTKIDVVAVRVHPSWATNAAFDPFDESIPTGFDVAVLKLASPIPGAIPARLAESSDASLWGNGVGLPSGARVAGWGVANPLHDEFELEEADYVQRELREVELPLLPDYRCEATDSPMGRDAALFDRSTMLCGYAGDTDKRPNRSNRRGACQGDSGGPLMVRDATGGSVLVGVVSWGPTGRGGCNRASVFTRVSGARPWIDSALSDIESPSTLVAPSIASATALDLNTMRIAWNAGSGDVRRYAVVQEFRARDLEALFGGDDDDPDDEDGDEEDTPTPEQIALINKLRFVAEFGSTGAEGRHLTVDGIQPVRAGSRGTVSFRIQATGDLGRRELGPLFTVPAPVDAKSPESPARPYVHSRRNGLITLRWKPVVDNDCVQKYEIQAKSGNGSWYRRRTFPGWSCQSVLWGFDDDELPTTGRPDHTYQHVLYDMAPGSTSFRVVAVDRAGNRAESARLSIDLERRVKRSNTLCGRMRGISDFERCKERLDGVFGETGGSWFG